MTLPLHLTCLCAAWCRTCDAYAPVVATVAAECGVPLRWLDIEDQAALLGEVDVETFPTLLLQSGDTVRFFGPVPPQPEALRRLLRAAPDAQPVPPEVQDLARRLNAT